MQHNVSKDPAAYNPNFASDALCSVRGSSTSQLPGDKRSAFDDFPQSFSQPKKPKAWTTHGVQAQQILAVKRQVRQVMHGGGIFAQRRGRGRGGPTGPASLGSNVLPLSSLSFPEPSTAYGEIPSCVYVDPFAVSNTMEYSVRRPSVPPSSSAFSVPVQAVLHKIDRGQKILSDDVKTLRWGIQQTLGEGLDPSALLARYESILTPDTLERVISDNIKLKLESAGYSCTSSTLSLTSTVQTFNDSFIIGTNRQSAVTRISLLGDLSWKDPCGSNLQQLPLGHQELQLMDNEGTMRKPGSPVPPPSQEDMEFLSQYGAVDGAPAPEPHLSQSDMDKQTGELSEYGEFNYDELTKPKQRQPLLSEAAVSMSQQPMIAPLLGPHPRFSAFGRAVSIGPAFFSGLHLHGMRGPTNAIGGQRFLRPSMEVNARSFNPRFEADDSGYGSVRWLSSTPSDQLAEFRLPDTIPYVSNEVWAILHKDPPINADDVTYLRKMLLDLMSNKEDVLVMIDILATFLCAEDFVRVLNENTKLKVASYAHVTLQRRPRDIEASLSGLRKVPPKLLPSKAGIFAGLRGVKLEGPGTRIRKDDPCDYEVDEIPGTMLVSNGKHIASRATKKWVMSVLYVLNIQGRDTDRFMQKMRTYFGDEFIEEIMQMQRLQKTLDNAKRNARVGVDGESVKLEGVTADGPAKHSDKSANNATILPAHDPITEAATLIAECVANCLPGINLGSETGAVPDVVVGSAPS